MKLYQVDLKAIHEDRVKLMTVWVAEPDKTKNWKVGSKIELTNMPGIVWEIWKVYEPVDEKLVKDSHDSDKVFDSLKK